MSAWVTVAGVTVPVAPSSKRTDTPIGDLGRTDDGSYFASITTTKRTWSVTTGYLSPADADTLRNALFATPLTTATGDWLRGATVNVWAFFVDETAVAGLSPVWVQVTFRMEEA